MDLKFRLEIIWWVITAVIVAVFLFPILQNAVNYLFYKYNILFIIVFVTLTRYIFLLKHTFLSHRMFAKAVIGFICIPFIFYLTKGLQEFQVYYDEIGLQEFYKHLHIKDQKTLIKFTKAQMFFFGTGSIIASILFPMRMIISIWRNYNKNTV